MAGWLEACELVLPREWNATSSRWSHAMYYVLDPLELAASLQP